MTLSPEPSLGPCVVVLEGTHARRVPIPCAGRVLIGRGDEVDLRIDDEGASRVHAALTISEGRFGIVDFESRNGTHLNGERITGELPVYPGDTIQIGGVSLVLVGGHASHTLQPALGVGEFRERMSQEVARALEVKRPSTLLVCRFDSVPDKTSVQARVMAQMRSVDVSAWTGPRELSVLLPELSRDECGLRGARALEALGDLSAKTGSASVPFEAIDTDGWIAAARTAASFASPGGLLAASEQGHTLDIGGQQVLVADPAMVRMYELLRRIAASELPVVIFGETGSGKEHAARAVHHWSHRVEQPFLTLNCAALPETLVESELFGHERGAFTGAALQRAGLLESASGGTLFLDEIGELSLAAQAKILRAVETQRVARIGSSKEISVDVRLVAATHRNLELEVREGRFRQDLYFRLAAATVTLLPLRDRPRELPLLARAFADEACARAGRPRMEISAEAMSILARYPWPGNVRELRYAIEFAIAAAEQHDDTIEVWSLPERIAPTTPQEAPATSPSMAALPKFRPLSEELREIERSRMVAALEAAGGVQTIAAELIGMPLRTFGQKYRLYKLGGRRAVGSR